MSKFEANAYFDGPDSDDSAFYTPSAQSSADEFDPAAAYWQHPTKSEMRQFNMVCCAKCHQTKHPRQFRRPLTWAQARARGYKGQRLMYVPSKFCRACSPATFRPSEMTEAQIVKAAYDGRVSWTRAHITIDDKKLKANALRKLAVNKRWHDHYAAPWVKLVQLLRVERARKRTEYDGTVGLLLYHDQLVRRVRARCELNARSEEPYPDAISWTYFMSDKDYARLQSFWDDAPPEKLKWLHPLPLLRPLPLFLADPTSTSVTHEKARALSHPRGMRLH